MCISGIESSIYYKDITDNTDFRLRFLVHEMRVQIPPLYFYRDIVSSKREIDLDRIRDILCGR